MTILASIIASFMMTIDTLNRATMKQVVADVIDVD
jgi:hypothetical protein